MVATMAELEKSEILHAGQQLLHYRVLGMIAEGGMSEVYLARDRERPADNALVVLKRVRPHLLIDSRFETMFENEARLAKLIDHPNVVEVYGLERSDDNLLLSMEFLSGKNLLAIGKTCDTGGFWVPHNLLAHVVAGAAAGLHHAHSLRDEQRRPLKLVHRDMSPENIIVTFDGRTKVVDFGVAKARLTPDTTQLGVVKGKLNYLAPEAIKGMPLDARADIYALGVTLYLFLTARFPYTAASADQLLDLMFGAEPAPPRKYNDQVPAALESICMRCLEKERDNRYQTAHEVSEALLRHNREAGTSVSADQVSAFLDQLYPRERDPMRRWLDAVLAEKPVAVVPDVAPGLAPPVMQHGGTAEMRSGETEDANPMPPAEIEPADSQARTDMWSVVTNIGDRADLIAHRLADAGMDVPKRSAPMGTSVQEFGTGRLRTWKSSLEKTVHTADESVSIRSRAIGVKRRSLRSLALFGGLGVLIGALLFALVPWTCENGVAARDGGAAESGRPGDAATEDGAPPMWDAGSRADPSSRLKRHRKKKRVKRPYPGPRPRGEK